MDVDLGKFLCTMVYKWMSAFAYIIQFCNFSHHNVLILQFKVFLPHTWSIISLYADDARVFLSNPSQSLPALARTLADYGSVAGYKINEKSILMSLSSSIARTFLIY